MSDPSPDMPDRPPEYDPFPPDLFDAFGVLRDILSHIRTLVAYEVRPYDGQRDRRRWRWQRPGCPTPEYRRQLELLLSAHAVYCPALDGGDCDCFARVDRDVE